MRELRAFQIAKLYFKITPFIFGEGFMLLGLTSVLKFAERDGVIIGSLLLIAGSIIVIYKILKTRKYYYSYKHGEQTIATVIDIQDSSWNHNGRTVNRYNFQFTIMGRKHNFLFNSGYHRQIKVGTKMELFFDIKYPENPFIPELFGLENQKENRS